MGDGFIFIIFFLSLLLLFKQFFSVLFFIMGDNYFFSLWVMGVAPKAGLEWEFCNKLNNYYIFNQCYN